MNFMRSVTIKKITSVALVAWPFFLIALYYSKITIPLSFYSEFSWDEFCFLFQINEIHKLINAGRFKALFLFENSFGYGTLFWWLYGIPSVFLQKQLNADSGSFLFSLRMITVATQWGCLFISYKILEMLKVRRLGVLIFTLLLFTMPGLILTYKPFSPDYLATFFSLLSVYFLVFAVQRQWSSKFLILSGLCLGIGANLKLTNAATIFIFLALGDVYFRYNRPSVSTFTKYTTIVAFSALFGFFATTPKLIISVPEYVDFIISTKQINDTQNIHAIHSDGFFTRWIYWYKNPGIDYLHGITTSGIRDEFVGYGLLSLIVFLALFSILRNKERDDINRALSLNLFWSSLCYIMLVICFTNRVWTWYLLAPIFSLTISLSSQIELLIDHVRSYSKSKKIISLVLIAFVLFHQIALGSTMLIWKLYNFQPSPQLITMKELQKENCVFNSLKKVSKPGQVLVAPYLPRHPLALVEICWNFVDFKCYRDDLDLLIKKNIKVLIIENKYASTELKAKIEALGFIASQCAPELIKFER